MSENRVNNYRSERVAAIADFLRQSRYREELQGFGLAGARTDARLELTNRLYFATDAVQSADAFQFHFVRDLERIDRLAFNYLGDSRLWWVIAELNPKEIPDTLKLQVGTYIKIPTLETIQSLLGS
jgi:hypothetical protein